MAKKAKFSVNGYFKDLMGWFKLMGRREAFIAAGDVSKLNMEDYPAKLSKEMHPGLIDVEIIEVKEETPSSRSFSAST